MNLLVDALPDAVMVGGVAVPVVTDFRAGLRVMLAFEDPDLTNTERQLILLRSLYPEVPEDVESACKQAVKFLDGGRAQAGEGKSGPRVFSWEKDQQLIYAAFQQTHGIDLATARLHWWQFLALFLDLGAETAFCQLTHLRRRVKTGKATKEERQSAAEMGDLFDVPEIDTRSLEEKTKADDFFKAVEEAERRRVQNQS